MSSSNIIFLWLEWHFVDTPKKILEAWFNLLRFNLIYFSIPVLLKTLFNYWHRYRMSYPRRLEPWLFFEVFVFNVMSRFIGAFLRSIFILAGFIFEIFIFVGGVFVLFWWIILPLAILIAFIAGVKIIL